MLQLYQRHEFPEGVDQYEYFPNSQTVLVRLYDGSVWQSQNEGYDWMRLEPHEHFTKLRHHPNDDERAYLLTNDAYFYATTDAGHSWIRVATPGPPSRFPAEVLELQVHPDYLLWMGDVNCERGRQEQCHGAAWYSVDNGKRWSFVEHYVRSCMWSPLSSHFTDLTEIFCESYSIKEGYQGTKSPANRLKIVSGKSFYAEKEVLFDNGFILSGKFSLYLAVIEAVWSQYSSKLEIPYQLSYDGDKFPSIKFPPTTVPYYNFRRMDHDSHHQDELTIYAPTLQSTMEWGSLLKSDFTGTLFVTSLDYVNGDVYTGLVDFERISGIEGIALANVVANPQEAASTGSKVLQSKITHNDGGTWEYLIPPQQDSLGMSYQCDDTNCHLHLRGNTMHRAKGKSFSKPSVVGSIVGVGNVGENLAQDYTASRTFISRDAGFSWEEIHKKSHFWEFGDSGSILVMVNDKEATNHVIFSKNQGLTWEEYQFADKEMFVKDIITEPSGKSRRFIVLGDFTSPLHVSTVAVHIDFSSLTTRQCDLEVSNDDSDFEWWSPSKNCLLGQQKIYHRRIREADCVVGSQTIWRPKYKEWSCACTKADFECEFNHARNENGDCVLIPGTKPLKTIPEGECDAQLGPDFDNRRKFGSWTRKTMPKPPYQTSLENCDTSDVCLSLRVSLLEFGIIGSWFRAFPTIVAGESGKALEVIND
ncbi:Oligoxyloglucan reducing end-specific cellobiohydrolase [Dendrothele bispora CBS 962.96]|uniref:Oligoxyloglucan reducing end-specific cellobiohydrolase n=1 Tax=Dendrothele bispora (strain CBS 962.96) TaxID=1314807 RepID=A0A4S8L145_DENBC|nr:Oligoxyloglucan reducing end-specific cellobiohydrolase [Dendrothele bispora CBS 962.96]